ncbi:Ig-like domain-containing protein [Isoptericola sp. NPDC057391]|uniref:Ig-like domain-containing protein n=1 Tax=Isoptericola sp. NPDC057391 TaxID=3346117 RepID=UPI00362FDFBD
MFRTGPAAPGVGGAPGRTRLVAAWTAFLVAAVTLVVGPPATAATEPDGRAPTTVEAQQLDTWWEGGRLELSLAVTAADGAAVDRGYVRVSVDGQGLRAAFLPTDRLQFPALPLSPGPHEVRLEYSGSPELAPSEWTGTLDVVAGTVPSSVTIDAPDTEEYGTAATATVTVRAGGAPAEGTVALLWDGGLRPVTTAVLTGGAATLTLPVVDPGRYAYEVAYYGGQGVVPSRASGSLVIERTQRRLQVWSNEVQDDGLWYTISRTMEVNVYVPDLYRLDADVSLYDGSRLIRRAHVDSTYTAAHSFRLKASELTTGKHTLVAKVTGSPYVEDMRATMAVTVRKDRAAVSIERGASPWVWGKAHKLRVYAVSEDPWEDAPVPRGTVTVYHGTKKVGRAAVDGDGAMTITLGAKSLPPGKARLRAVYTGDGIYYGRTAYRTIRVAKAHTKTSATLVDRSLRGAQRGKVKVVVKAWPAVASTGTLVVKVDGKAVRTVRLAKNDKGRRTIVLPRVARGHHWFTVHYRATSTTKASQSRNANYFTVR